MNRFARERLRVGANEVSSASTMYLDASMRPCLAARRRWTSCSIVAGDTQAKVCLCSYFGERQVRPCRWSLKERACLITVSIVNISYLQL